MAMNCSFVFLDIFVERTFEGELVDDVRHCLFSCGCVFVVVNSLPISTLFYMYFPSTWKSLSCAIFVLSLRPSTRNDVLIICINFAFSVLIFMSYNFIVAAFEENRCNCGSFSEGLNFHPPEEDNLLDSPNFGFFPGVRILSWRSHP